MKFHRRKPKTKKQIQNEEQVSAEIGTTEEKASQFTLIVAQITFKEASLEHHK